jgi:lambda family phage portal protein
MERRFAELWPGEAYRAASHRDRMVRHWNPLAALNPDEELLPERLELVARCRDEYRNNPIARSAVNTPVISIVGCGLAMQCRIDRAFLGMSDEEASAWESKTERLFASWASHTDADAMRRESFFGLQQLAYRSYRLSGEVFALLPIIKRPGTICDLRVQMVEADRVSTPITMADAGVLHSGIETGNNGEPVAYHVETTPIQPFTPVPRTWARVSAFGSTGRQNVIHLYQQDRPGQRRGMPSLTPILICLKKIGQYTESELLAAVVSSLFTIFIKSDSDKLMEDLTGGIRRPIEGEANPPQEPRENMDLGPGAILRLDPDEDISAANPGRPNSQFDPFISAILRQIGMALNIPYEILVKHFSSSYSASRAAIMQAWEFYKTERAMFIDKFCQPIYEEWLWIMVLSGRIAAPGFLESIEIRRAYFEAAWHGPVPLQIDPVKEATAAAQRLDIGISTIAEETAMITGNNWEENFSQRSKENEMAKKLELSFAILPPLAPQANDEQTSNIESDSQPGGSENGH